MKPSRRLSIVMLISLALLSPLSGATSKKNSAKKLNGKPTVSASSSKGKKSKGKSYSASSKRSRKAQSERFVPRQANPTPERIQDIQRALAQKGIPVDASGEMNASTIEAIKTFQQQQKLDVTGKLDAMTLIGLGLGPKRDENPAARAEGNSSASLPPQERNQ